MKLIMDSIGLCTFGKGAILVLDALRDESSNLRTGTRHWRTETFQSHYEKDCDRSLQVSPRTLLAMFITVGNLEYFM